MNGRISKWTGAFGVACLAVGVFASGRANAAGEADRLMTPLRTLDAARDDGSVVLAARRHIRESDEIGRRSISRLLAGVAVDPTATLDGRRAACRLLFWCATSETVDALAPLLKDPELGHLARRAIEGLPDEAVDRALLAALTSAPPAMQQGIIGSLARRRTTAAVPELARLAAEAEPNVAVTAIRALGDIGSEAALRALQSLQDRPELASARMEALVETRWRISGESDDRAKADLTKLPAEAGQSAREASLRLALRQDAARVAVRLAELFRSDDAAAQAMAARALEFLPDDTARRELIGRASGFPLSSQVLILENYAARGWTTGLELARGRVDSDDPALQRAAIDALGELGTAADVPALLRILGEGGEAAAAAVRALGRLPDPSASAVLLEEYRRKDSPVREKLPDVLADRGLQAAIEPMLADATEADRAFASELYQAIGKLGSPELVGELLKRRASAAPTHRAPIERAIVTIGRRAPAGLVTRQLVARWSEADGAERAGIVRMAGGIADEAALEFLRPLAEATPPDEGAIRALLAWPDADALPVVWPLVQRSNLPDTTRRLAWQATYRLAGLRAWRGEMLAWMEKCMSTATTADERRQVIEAIGRQTSTAALEELAQWVDDPEIGAAAREARAEMQERLSERITYK